MRCGEWVGALVTLPTFITGEGEPYRPAAVMWIEPETGLIIDSQLVHPDEALRLAAPLFEQATRAPHVGQPRVPRRVRVATAELAQALRAHVTGVEIVVAPTPEIEPVLASLTEHLKQPSEDDAGTYLGPEITADEVGRMFQAMARLYRLQPWRVFPADGLAAVTCERLAIDDGAICVVGQSGDSFGFLMCRTNDDMRTWIDAAKRREPDRVPGHMMVSYDSRTELTPALLHEIKTHAWEVAGPHAYPSIIIMEPELFRRGPTRTELVGLTEIVDSLAELLEHHPALGDAWDTDREVARAAANGVAIRVPLWLSDGPIQFEAEDAARGIVDHDGIVDDELLERHREALVERFEASREATPEFVAWAEILIDCLADTCACTFVEITPRELTTFVFEIIPREISVEPSAAAEIIGSIRALLAFVVRELTSKSAARCLAALSGDAAQRLERALANPKKFGPAKLLFMEGTRAGFDMTSEAGITAFVAAMRKPSKPKPKPKPRSKKPPAKKRR